MNKFKALVIKDYLINKKTLFTPFWITIGFYFLVLISMGIGYFKGDLRFHGIEYLQSDVQLPALAYIINMGMVMLPGFIAVLFTITTTQTALNDDLKRNCELFHRSQPVSYWLRSLSKFCVTIGGNWVVLLIISLFNYLIINLILAFFGQYSAGASISGMLLAFLYFVKITLLIGSITFFLSAIFKEKAFFTGLAILFGTNFLFMLLNALLGWHLPLPMKYLADLFSFQSQIHLEGDPTSVEYGKLVAHTWKMMIFNWKSLLQVVVSGIFFAAATLIYKSKEVK